MKKNIKYQLAFTIVEILVCIGIILILFTGFLQLVQFNYISQQAGKHKIEAVDLATESIEIVHQIRYADWANISSLTAGIAYYPVLVAGVWTLSTTNPGNINNLYQRWVVFEAVNRDANDNIAAVGVADPNTKKITSYISWNERGDIEQISLVSYLTNWR